VKPVSVRSPIRTHNATDTLTGPKELFESLGSCTRPTRYPASLVDD
jgi:hypothetical protein